jgi:hypothetical protein
VSTRRRIIHFCRGDHYGSQVIQARWLDDDPFANLPHWNSRLTDALERKGIEVLPQLMDMPRGQVASLLRKTGGLKPNEVQSVQSVLSQLPRIDLSHRLVSTGSDSSGAAQVTVGDVLELQVTLRRANGSKTDVFAPKWTRPQKEGVLLSFVSGSCLGDTIIYTAIVCKLGDMTVCCCVVARMVAGRWRC